MTDFGRTAEFKRCRQHPSAYLHTAVARANAVGRQPLPPNPSFESRNGTPAGWVERTRSWIADATAVHD